MIIKDKRTNEIISTGDKNPRLSKLIRRVYAWSTALNELEKLQKYGLKMITLTYSPDHTWEANHIRDYIQALRRSVKHNLLAYAWVAEKQKRGEIHYHLYCIVVPGTFIPKPDSSGMWPWGMSKTETGKSVFYISSYTGKKYQKEGVFPKGIRTYAVWIKQGLLEDIDYWKFKLSAYPIWLVEEIQSFGSRFVGQIPFKSEGSWAIKDRYSKFENDNVIHFESPYEIIRFTTPEPGQKFYVSPD